MRIFPVWALGLLFIFVLGCGDDPVESESSGDTASESDTLVGDIVSSDIETNDATGVGGSKDVEVVADQVASDVSEEEPDIIQTSDGVSADVAVVDVIADVEANEDIEEPPPVDVVEQADVPVEADVSPPAQCDENGDCGESWVCDKPDCSLQAGTCVAAPIACPDVEDFQCGCDEVTYSNDCERLLVGVGLAYPGECVEVDAACVSDGDDCAPGQFCLAAGCGPGLIGSCQPMPLFCNDDWEGVCGCDGVAYANECVAHKSGILVAGPGSCPEGGLNCEVAILFGFGTGCGLGEYCMGGCEGLGYCKDKGPPNCSAVPMSVVCSCSDNSYGNLCLAQSAGQNVDYPGWCEGDSGTPDNTPCAGPLELLCEEDKYCNVESCDEMAEGVCIGIWTLTTPGFLCLPSEPEECGCDGVTYLNYCQRVMAGAAKAYDGPCTGDGNPNPCLLGHVGDCGPGLYCAGPVGQCTGDGICVATDFLCVLGPHLPDACGCDGVTYDSACDAQKKDIPVQFFGTCPIICGDNNCDESECDTCPEDCTNCP